MVSPYDIFRVILNSDFFSKPYEANMNTEYKNLEHVVDYILKRAVSFSLP